MTTFIKHKILKLHTSNPSCFGLVTKFLGSDSPSTLTYWGLDSNFSTSNNIYPLHLHILDNDGNKENIKEGDYVFENNLSCIYIYPIHNRNNQLGIFRFRNVFIPIDKTNCIKIIATTDISLILPQIPISFIKEYCQNPSNEIEIKYTHKLIEENGQYGNHYTEILIPQIIDNIISIKPSKIKKETYTVEEVKELFNDFHQFIKTSYIDQFFENL